MDPRCDRDGRSDVLTMICCPNQKVVTAIGIALVCLIVSTAYAKSPVCVEIKGSVPAKAGDLRQLVTSEIRRHLYHRPADTDCEQTLFVEFSKFESMIYVTAYLDGQVPARAAVQSGKPVDKALQKVVASALKSDPVAWLSDTPKLINSVLASDVGLLRGVMLYGVEAFQTIVLLNEKAAFLPGIGIRFRREWAQFSVGARTTFSFSLASPKSSGDPTFKWVTTMEPEFSWYATPNALNSFYIGAALGVGVVQIEGIHTSGDRDTSTDVWLTLGGRMGWEFMRAQDFRFDAFVQVNTPLDRTQSDDGDVIDSYTPWMQVGGSVSF